MLPQHRQENLLHPYCAHFSNCMDYPWARGPIPPLLSLRTLTTDELARFRVDRQ